MHLRQCSRDNIARRYQKHESSNCLIDTESDTERRYRERYSLSQSGGSLHAFESRYAHLPSWLDVGRAESPAMTGKFG